MGTGRKVFSSGFDFIEWSEHPLNPSGNASVMAILLRKLLILPVPTFCLMNGHCVAAGLFYALCNDYRIMKKASRVWLTELANGLPLPGAFHNTV